MKPTPLLAMPPTVTTTLLVTAPWGTVMTMFVGLQLVATAPTGLPGPLNVTVLEPCVVPKFVPVIVTDVPRGPDEGFKLVIVGGGTGTVKFTPLLGMPLAA